MKRFATVPLLRLYLACAACLLALAVAVPVRGEIIERVLVKVNGEIFTKSDLENRQVQVLREQGQNQPQNDADLRKRVERLTPQILVDAIDEMLLVQRAKELGYHMTDDQFNDVLTRLKTDNKITTEEQFQAALKQEGLSVTDLRKSIERRMMIERVEQSEVFGHISVTQDEMKRYYEQHKNDFMSVPTVTLREILIKVPSDGKSVNVGADEAARKRAEGIRERALKGESFEKLADLSDAPSKANGGLIGPVSRSDIDPNFAKMLATMKPGDISDVLRTQSGYDVVKLEAVSDTKLLPFDDARQQIGNKIFASKQQAAFEEYIRKLRAAALIDWKVPEFKKLYDEQVARLQAAPAGAVQQ